MRCPNCGNTIPSHVKFCAYCGASVGTTVKHKGCQTSVWVIFGLILLGLLIWLIAWIVNSCPTETTTTTPDVVSTFRQVVPATVQDGDWFPDGSKIVFSKQTYTYDTGGYGEKLLYRIFVMNSDGSNEVEIGLKQASTEIIDRIGYEDHVAPLVSPDGQRIAFVVDRHDHPATIWVMNTDGTDLHQVTPWYDSIAYSWSSSNMIVYWGSPYVYGGFDEAWLFSSEYGNVYITDISHKTRDQLLYSEGLQQLEGPTNELLTGKFISLSVSYGCNVVDLLRYYSVK